MNDASGATLRDQGQRSGEASVTKHMKMIVSPDQTRVVIEFLPESGASGRLDLAREDLPALVKTLSDLHVAMNEGKDTQDAALFI